MANTPYKVSVSQEIDDEWDDFVENSKDGNYEQTSIWAAVKKRYGWAPKRLILKKNKEIIAGAQILFKKTKFGNVGYLSKGPVLNNSDSNEIENIFLYLFKITKINKIIFLYINPPMDFDNLNTEGLKRKLSPDFINEFIGATLLIDLDRRVEEMFGQMRRMTRRSINKGLKRGIIVIEAGRSEIQGFFNLMLSSCKRQGVAPNPPDVDFIYSLWDLFRPRNKIHLFTAQYEGVIVAAILLISFGVYIKAWKIGWSGKHREKNPTSVLYWETMKWAKENGFKYYDFIGIDRKVAEAVINNGEFPEGWQKTISFNKLGFGGEVKLLPDSYVYIYNPFFRLIYTKFFPRLSREKSWKAWKRRGLEVGKGEG